MSSRCTVARVELRVFKSPPARVVGVFLRKW